MWAPAAIWASSVGLDPAEVAGRHFLGKNLAPGGIDAFADDDKRTIEADDDFLACGADDGIGHDCTPVDVGWNVCLASDARESRSCSTPDPLITISATDSSWR
jgi:hypothetical protein